MSTRHGPCCSLWPNDCRPLDADASAMTVHLVNPSHLSFGVGVITPRWLFVLAGATPTSYGRPRITDETLEPFDIHSVQPGDVVGVGIHTGNALRGYEIGTLARDRGATVIFGGIHATLYPTEAQTLGGAHAVVKGDGDVAWPLVLDDARTAPSDFEAIPADVREHGNRDRQCTRESRESLGAPDRQTVSSPVCRAPSTCTRENGLRCLTSAAQLGPRRVRWCASGDCHSSRGGYSRAPS
jgi:hypothetical protein